MPDIRRRPAQSPQQWRAVRGVLKARRHDLVRAAARLYPDLPRVGTTDLLCRPEWLPAAPLDLDEVALAWNRQPPAPAVPGTGDICAHVLPAGPAGQPYANYTEAVAALDPPALLHNRACYRLLDASLDRQPVLSLGLTGYFDAVSIGHAVAHELATVWRASPSGFSGADLPLRNQLGDPSELRRRCAIPAITTLTLRRTGRGQADFLLHWRDPAKVNHGGGVYQVVPVGVFQPVNGTPAAVANDLSLWRGMAREFSEELLGASEDYQTSGGVLDYDGWPFYRQLSRARRAGAIRVHCLGAGVDPLTLATDILTVAVFDAAVFDTIFGDLVAVNAEGRLFTEGGSPGIPLSADSVTRFAGGDEPVQPSGAAVLQLAWRHRRHLLG